ncbi:MAG: sigma-70 family RNA polymerase sigma factor [Anaerolineales bacterium]|nr:sigma-70 family RNA polymerase sigma factor [Anaerolineales bacterium]
MYERTFSGKEEQYLIKRAKECDPSAFAALYERYHQDIYNYIYYRTASEPVAEDLTSDVFLKALESIDSFTFRGIPFSAWLFRIAKNMMSEYFRGKAKTIETTFEEETLPSEGQADDALEAKLTQQRLARAIGDLTEDQQQVIVLKFVDGFSNTDIAQILDKSEGAIKSLQHRALGALNRIWQEIYPEEDQDLMIVGRGLRQ